MRSKLAILTLVIASIVVVSFTIITRLSSESSSETLSLEVCSTNSQSTDLNEAVDVENVQFSYLRTIDENKEFVRYVKLSSNGRYLFESSPIDRAVLVWDIQNGEMIQRFEAINPGSLAISPDGLQLAAVVDRRSVIIWNLVTGEISYELNEFLYDITYIIFGSNSDTLITTSASSEGLQLWDLSKSEVLQTMDFEQSVVVGLGANLTVTCLLVVERITSGLSDERYYTSLVDMVNFRKIRISDSNSRVGIAFSPNGSYYALINGALGNLSLINTINHEETGVLHRVGGPSSFFSTAPILITTNYSIDDNNRSDIILWDINRNQQVALLNHNFPILSVEVASDDSTIAVVNSEGIHIWQNLHSTRR